MKLTAESRKALVGWWHWLDDNRGDRAVLRRATIPDDVLLAPAFAHFLQRMPADWSSNQRIPLTDAALVASVLARVRQSASKSFAAALATAKEGGGKAAMSELRFQQLQKSRTPEEFFTRICRAVDLLGGTADVASLAEDILHWLEEQRYGPASKPDKRLAVRWASDYYANYKE